MNRRTILNSVLFLAIGLAVGWTVGGRNRERHAGPPPMPEELASAYPISIYQPRVPEQPACDLAPVSIQHGPDLKFFDDGPADPRDVVLISFNHGALLITCKKLK